MPRRREQQPGLERTPRRLEAARWSCRIAMGPCDAAPAASTQRLAAITALSTSVRGGGGSMQYRYPRRGHQQLGGGNGSSSSNIFNSMLGRNCCDVPNALHLAGTHARPCAVARVRRELKAVWTSDGILAKWEETSQGKKRKVRAMRASTNDFERFQIQVAKSKRSAIRKSK